MKWDEFFIKMAMHVATKSKDPSTKVGCVIVGPDNEVRSTGFNGFPRGVSETVMETQVAHFVKETEYDIVAQDVKALCTCGEIVPVDPFDFERGFLPTHFSGEPLPAKEVLHPERWDRPLKYDFIEHAERNAVYNAARVGIPTAGCRAYLNWEPHPCKECTKALIQAGIVEIIGPAIPFPNNNDWKFDVSRTMLLESGVPVTEVSWDAERGDNL